MKRLLSLCILATSCLVAAGPENPDQILMEANTPIGLVYAYRPDREEIEKTAPIAKAMFQEAFATTYTEYYHQSKVDVPIEKWLLVREGLTLQSWLTNVFDDEYEEYLHGQKEFILICDGQGNFIGWLSHSPVATNGDLYLSQCSLEADSRNHKIATTAFTQLLIELKRIFPNVKEIKLITRKINIIARNLFLKAGFTMDLTIDPSVYGDSYDDRYVGYRLSLNR